MRRAMLLWGALAGCAEEVDLGLPSDHAPVPRAMNLTVSDPVRPGTPIRFDVTGAVANSRVRLIRSNGGVGAGACPPILDGACLDILPGSEGYVMQLELVADAQGRASFTANLPGRVPDGANLSFQAIDPDMNTGSNPVVRVAESQCQDDAMEDHDTYGTAMPVSSGQQVSAWSCLGDLDWYAVQANAGQVIEATVDFDARVSNLDVRMFNGLGALLVEGAFMATAPERVSYVVAQTGTHYIGIGSRANSSPFGADYDLFVNVASPNTCSPDSWEPNNDGFTQARALPVGLTTGFTTCTVNDFDWYRIDLTMGQTVDVSVLFSNGEGDLDAWLLPAPTANSTSEFNRSYLDRGISAFDDEHLTWTAGYTGPHYLVVRMYQDAGTGIIGNRYDVEVQTN